MTGKDFVKSTIIGYALLAVLVLIGSDVPVSSAANCDQLTEALKRFEKEDKNPIYSKFCRNGQCIQINVNTVAKLYPNLLVMKRNIPATDGEKNLNSDRDTCCPTARSFNIPETLRNIRGFEQTIYQTPQLSQMVPVGNCTHGGVCRSCSVKTRTMTILVIDFEKTHYPPVVFDQFEIPMYCTCSEKRFASRVATLTTLKKSVNQTKDFS